MLFPGVEQLHPQYQLDHLQVECSHADCHCLRWLVPIEKLGGVGGDSDVGHLTTE